MFGELEHPEDPEITKDKTEWCGGETIGIGRAGVSPEARSRVSQRRRRRRTEGGDVSGAVAGPADLANHRAGGSGDAAVSTTISELNSEQGALPDRRGGIVGAGG